MKSCVQGSSSHTLELSHPSFALLKASPCPLPSSRKILGKDCASILLLRVQKRCSKPLHLTVFFFNGDGGDRKLHADEWPRMDTSHVKRFTWEALKRWGPPAIVGAMAGSIVARKTNVFVVSLSIIVLMALHKAVEVQGVHSNRVSDVFSRQALTNLLPSTKLLLSTAILYMSGAIMACLRRSSMYIDHILVPMRSSLANKQSYVRDLLTLNSQPRDITTDSMLGSDSKSAETLMTDISACIRNVEGIIMTDKDVTTDTKWKELKDSLDLLMAKVTNLSKGYGYVVPSSDITVSPVPAIKAVEKKPKSSAPVKSKGGIKQQMGMDKMQAVRVENILVNKSVDVVKEDAMHASTGGHEYVAPHEAAADQTAGLLFKEMNDINVSHAQPLDVTTVKIGKGESRSLRPKYIDYWTEQDPNEFASSAIDLEKGKHKELSTDSYSQRKGLVLQASQAMQRENASTLQSPDSGGKSFYAGECAGLSNEVGSKNAGNESDISSRVNNGDDSKEHVRSVDNATASRRVGSTNDNIKVKEKALQKKSQSSTLNVDHKEQGGALLGSTKELAFVREDEDLHVLTGFSRRVNEKEYKKMMTDGETALRHGKAGLSGDIEVGEAETMLNKAADYFASAAALDLASVEAIGFWGNTLLVHGELKLMLSRELRHLISTPDVISPYWIRQQNKGMEPRERGNRAALQRTYQTVCEECEELLIQAGRKYRRVLSISNSEVRALYNWGLALCFRAQLIAEEGGQDAREAADRIYLAAIDKFEAMMGISQRYAPGAMLNWGLTLKQRSRLWPSDSAERISLLQQAKQLFIDALRLQPDDAQIHSAFVTCTLELKELNERQEFRSNKRGPRPFFGK